jgi:hypothetical protein
MQDGIQVPQPVLDLLLLREGWETVVYEDTATPPNATAGMGHKLLPSELHLYPNGSTVPDDVLEDWKDSDSTSAYVAACSQARQIGSTDQRLINALACVSFQLGSFWYKKLFGTWALLMAHQWSAAANHEELSLWAQQTPERAADFATALNSLDTPATA